MKKLRATLLAAGITMMACSVASAQTELKISIAVAQNSIQGTAIDTFAEEIKKRTDGRYMVSTFYAGALGAEREAVEAVQLGTLDLTFTSTGPVSNFVPEVKVFDVPYLFKDYAHARAVLDGPIGQEMLNKFPSKGMVALAWGENGFRHMTNSKHPIHTPADMENLKIRTMENPIYIQSFKAFGILPTPMAWTELFTALQQGTVDGQESPIPIIAASKFDQVQKYLTLTGHTYSPCVFLMNKALYDKLSPEDQKVFVEAAKVAAQANRDRVDREEAADIAKLKEHGVQVVETIDQSLFQKALEPVQASFDEQFGKETLDKIRNYSY